MMEEALPLHASHHRSWLDGGGRIVVEQREWGDLWPVTGCETQTAVGRHR